jgi:hypothetical protein
VDRQKSDGRTLPGFVTEELHKFLDCGILARGFAHFFCKTCHEHYAGLPGRELAQ